MTDKQPPPATDDSEESNTDDPNKRISDVESNSDVKAEDIPVHNLDNKQESAIGGFMRWISDHRGATIAIIAVIALIATALVWRPWDDPMENQESVAPERSWNEEGTHQEFLPEAKVIQGQGISSMTMPDNEQDGEIVSFDIVSIDAVDNGTGGATLAPPQDISKIGHYVRSPHAGEEEPVGSALYTSHVNYAGAVGVGSVWTSLRDGDAVTFTDEDGIDHYYTIAGDPYRLDKSDPDYVQRTAETINDMESTDGRVVLISCGGEFIGGSLGYADNVFVVAYPAEKAPQS